VYKPFILKSVYAFIYEIVWGQWGFPRRYGRFVYNVFKLKILSVHICICTLLPQDIQYIYCVVYIEHI
jgi:hypothetical protein